MVLTEKLWKFWEGLNEGKINWQFINDENISNREKSRAKKMVINRGFVNVFDINESPKDRPCNWKVLCGGNMNPCYDGRRWYFTAKKYAKDYARYLHENGKISKFYKVEV